MLFLNKAHMWEKILARCIDQARINKTAQITYKGKVCLLKNRLPLRGVLIFFGNIFLRFSKSQIHMFVSATEWVRWEVECYKTLHPSLFVQIHDAQSFVVKKLHGKNLLTMLQSGHLNKKQMKAVGLAFKEAHQRRSAFFNSSWSHGDPHLENVLFDDTLDQAFLVDFETQHNRSLSTIQRHADDLLVFCLDLLGRADNYLELIETFLRSYENSSVLNQLRERLHAPQKFEYVLWLTRTNFLPRQLLESRLLEVKHIVAILTDN